MTEITYGQIVFYTGIVLIGISVLAAIVGIIYFSIKTKSLRKQLIDIYGI